MVAGNGKPVLPPKRQEEGPSLLSFSGAGQCWKLLAAVPVLGPVPLGSFVLAFIQLVGEMVTQARGRPIIQKAWRWVMGLGAGAALYGILGISLF
jgi:hypothetical protein